MKHIEDRETAKIAFVIYSVLYHLATLICIGTIAYASYIGSTMFVVIFSGLGLLCVRKLYGWSKLKRRAADSNMELVDYINKLNEENESK